MIASNLFAQATDTPQNGASRAEDFQPQTQNPQVPGNTQDQQAGHNLQNTGDQQILNDPTAHINVPVNPAPPPATLQVTSASVNLYLVVAVSIVLALIAEYIWRARRKASTSSAAQLASVSAEEVTEQPLADQPVSAKVAAPKALKPKPKPKAKTKSKSTKGKRKKK